MNTSEYLVNRLHDRLEQFLIVISIWVLILIISPLVLKNYRFGPLEWFWRTLTYFSLKN